MKTKTFYETDCWGHVVKRRGDAATGRRLPIVILVLLFIIGTTFAVGIDLDQSNFSSGSFNAYSGNTIYWLTEDITLTLSGYGFTPMATGITLNCDGYSISGGRTSFNTAYNNQTITGCNFIGFSQYGVSIINSSGSLSLVNISNTYINGANSNGIIIDAMSSNVSVKNVFINNNTISADRGAIIIYSGTTRANDSNLTNVNISNNIIIANNAGPYFTTYGIDIASTGDLSKLNISNNTIVTAYRSDPSMVAAINLYSGKVTSPNTILGNNIYSEVWVNDLTSGGNDYNNSNSGNNYYFSDGTTSSSIYNVTTDSPPNWATAGTDRPYNATNTPNHWFGTGSDWFPWTYYSYSYIDYCGGITNSTTIRWYVYDLLTNSQIPFNMTTNMQQMEGNSLVVSSFNGSGNATNFSLCVYPDNGTVYAQTTDIVTSPGYYPITWAHAPTNYSNITEDYIVYLTPIGSYAKLVQILVVDSNYNPMTNVSVKIQQVSPITSTIILLGEFLVDNFGITTQALQPATQLYRFTVTTPSGTILQNYSDQAIPCASTDLVCKVVLVVKDTTTIPTVPAVTSPDGPYTGTTSFGRDGFLAAILLVVVAATLMTGSIAVSMVLGVFGLFAAFAFGLIPLADAPVAFLFAIVALGIAYRLRI